MDDVINIIISHQSFFDHPRIDIVTMFYFYLRFFNWLCCLFGLKKPFLLKSGKCSTITGCDRFWSTFVVIAFVTLYLIAVNESNPASSKINLHKMSNVNDLVVNIIIIVIDIVNGDKWCLELYGINKSAFNEFKISNRALKMMALKLYVWFSWPIAIYIASIFVEMFTKQPPEFIPFVRIPCLLTVLHVQLHLYLQWAVLKLLNNKLSQVNHTKFRKDSLKVARFSQNVHTLKYFLDFNRHFIEINDLEQDLSLTTLCKLYDSLGTCIQLLEKQHGKQMLLSIWMMFSSAVMGATLISCEETENDWMVITRALLPFTWLLYCSFINDRLFKEVEWTEILIMKHLIDFRCDLPKRSVLETFKQLVATNGLQFTAANLFHLNYAMILGTAMNAITYTIILVQLFISSD